MRSLPLLIGLTTALALGACGTDTPPTDGTAAAPSDTAMASGDGANSAPCEPDRGLNDIPSPGSCSAYALGDGRLEVQYGAPSVREREIFGALVPYGEVWRTGANEATTFSTTEDLLVAGDTLAAGTYGLFTLPTEGEWAVIFNAVSDQWGAFEYDEGQDVLRVAATPEATAAPVERLAITFEDGPDGGAMLVLAWADTRVAVPLAPAEPAG